MFGSYGAAIHLMILLLLQTFGSSGAMLYFDDSSFCKTYRSVGA